MRVLKFGGTSVGSAQNMRKVANIIQKLNRPAIVVLSAMSGTTNQLVEICNLLKNNEQNTAITKVNALEYHYIETANELIDGNIDEVQDFISQEFNELRNLCIGVSKTNDNTNKILIRGEIITTKLFQSYISELGINASLLPALQFMRTDIEGNPDYFYIKEKLNYLLKANPADIIITQGYACINTFGEVSNLGRGGSDFTATIIGTVINADVVEIWTDIDGLHNNDPRFVEDTYPINELTYEEAEELAYFGAKILHPTCIKPVKSNAIPVVLKNTFQPEAPGTLIQQNSNEKGIKAVAAKDNIIAIKVKSGGMLNAYGFLRKLFSVFEDYKCPVDMITTSEIAVSMTIEDNPYLTDLLTDLRSLGEISVQRNQSIICIVGDFTHNSRGYISQISNSLQDTSIRMISYGASEHNICLLIDSQDKTSALNQINNHLFSRNLQAS